jgi:hypothetical protein
MHPYFRRYLENAIVAKPPPPVRSASTERLTPRSASTPPLPSPRSGARASSEREAPAATDVGDTASLEGNSQHDDCAAGGKASASAVDPAAESSQAVGTGGGDGAADVEVSRDENGGVHRGSKALEAMGGMGAGQRRSKAGRGMLLALQDGVEACILRSHQGNGVI